MRYFIVLLFAAHFTFCAKSVTTILAHKPLDEILKCDAQRVSWFHHIKNLVLYVIE